MSFKVGDRVVVRVPDSHDWAKGIHDGRHGVILSTRDYTHSQFSVKHDEPHQNLSRGIAHYPAAWLEAESKPHRRFVLQRDEDETGVSGTGVVAEGVEFSDGVVALRWIVPAGAPGAGHPTSVVFHDRGIASVEKIHGHGGKTQIKWVD